MNRDEFLALHDGLEWEQVWRRSKCEMAFIKQEGREAELDQMGYRTYTNVHDLAQRILDEQIVRDKKLIEEWNQERLS